MKKNSALFKNLLIVIAVVASVGGVYALLSRPPNSESKVGTEPSANQNISGPESNYVNKEVKNSEKFAQAEKFPLPSNAELEVQKQVFAIATLPNITVMKSKELVEKLSALGFKFEQNQTPPSNVGSSSEYKLTGRQNGFIDLSLNYVADEKGEFLTGLRFTLPAEQFEAAKQAFDAQKGDAKLLKSDENFTLYSRSDGYDLWINRYNEKDPANPQSEAGTIKVGLEPNPD